MNQTEMLLVGLIGAAAIGFVATLGMLVRERRRASATGHESPFAVSTEGMMRCPACGVGNLVTDDTCSGCKRRLPR